MFDNLDKCQNSRLVHLHFTRTGVLCLYLNKSAITHSDALKDPENKMTIIRNGHKSGNAKDFVVIGVGGAGSTSATELSKVLGNPDDVIAVDRDLDALRTVTIGRRISIGHPIFIDEEDESGCDNLVDPNDLFRLKTVIGKTSLVFVLAGLGGASTLELLPSVLRTAMSTGASVLAIVTLPFALEGRTRSNTAATALQRVREVGCSLAVIDADGALSTGSIAGDLASELTAAKARVVMNVLSASSAATSGALNTSPEMLDAIKCGGETFISYASSEDAAEFRKVARDATKRPISSGLALRDAEYVSVVIAGPRDMSIKSLNAAISIVQNELSDEAVLSTSFVPNAETSNSGRVRVSVIAGRDPKPQMETVSPAETVKQSHAASRENGVSGQIDDLLGAPDWLAEQPTDQTAVAALL